MGFSGSSDGKASAYNVGDSGLIPGSGRSPGEGKGNPLQYSCLENPMDRGAWWATIHGVAKSRTRLSDFCVCVCVLCVRHFANCFNGSFLSLNPPNSTAEMRQIICCQPQSHASASSLLLSPSIFPCVSHPHARSSEKMVLPQAPVVGAWPLSIIPFASN